MLKYHFRISDGIKDKKENAGNKAVADCKQILLKNGYRDLEITFSRAPLLLPLSLLKLFCLLTWYLIRIPKGSLVFTQYPLLGINRFFRYYAEILKLKKCRLACIIHDLDSIRSENPVRAVPKEIAALNVYDAVISHNLSMTEWLKANSFKGLVNEIGLFDYLSDDPQSDLQALADPKDRRTVFAGSLSRTNFLHLTGNIPNLQLDLYGPGFGTLKKVHGMSWKGSFQTNEIASALKGHFGLVWDGDSVEECRGIMGNYLRYNTPHKVSLYLIAGLPLIVPEHSAIAGFVRSEGIGICISSLEDLPEQVRNAGPESYQAMQEKVKAIGEHLRKGLYFEKALAVVEKDALHG